MKLQKSQIDIAYEIAREAHFGQEDKGGNDYIQHPLMVASMVVSNDEKTVALLHDVVEDSETTFDDLTEKGLPFRIVEAVRLLTKQKSQPYETYIRAIKGNALARAVKIADMKHNSDLSRLREIRECDRERVSKYQKMITYLSN